MEGMCLKVESESVIDKLLTEASEDYNTIPVGRVTRTDFLEEVVFRQNIEEQIWFEQVEKGQMIAWVRTESAVLKMLGGGEVDGMDISS